MSRKAARNSLSRDELLAKLHADDRIVDVPGVGSVHVRVPSFQRLVEIKTQCESEDDYRLAMILASCPDLEAKDLEAIRTGNGFAVAALVNAVTSLDKPLTDDDVGKQ